jgi:hypothetical protein
MTGTMEIAESVEIIFGGCDKTGELGERSYVLPLAG